MKKLIAIVGSIVLFLFTGFFLLNSYIYWQKQSSPNQSYGPYRGNLSGEYTCLPPNPKLQEVTLECALGLKTERGEYYAADFSLMAQEAQMVQTGQHISANGLITPIENLSSNHWGKYDIAGVFSITDSLIIR